MTRNKRMKIFLKQKSFLSQNYLHCFSFLDILDIQDLEMLAWKTQKTVIIPLHHFITISISKYHYTILLLFLLANTTTPFYYYFYYYNYISYMTSTKFVSHFTTHKTKVIITRKTVVPIIHRTNPKKTRLNQNYH